MDRNVYRERYRYICKCIQLASKAKMLKSKPNSLPNMLSHYNTLLDKKHSDVIEIKRQINYSYQKTDGLTDQECKREFADENTR